MLNGKTEIELDINADSIRLIANSVIFYNASILSALYQHYLTIDPEKAKEIVRFSPVAWQHINFIGKYEFYNQEHIVCRQSPPPEAQREAGRKPRGNPKLRKGAQSQGL